MNIYDVCQRFTRAFLEISVAQLAFKLKCCMYMCVRVCMNVWMPAHDPLFGQR